VIPFEYGISPQAASCKPVWSESDRQESGLVSGLNNISQQADRASSQTPENQTPEWMTPSAAVRPTAASRPIGAPGANATQRIPLWLERTELLLRVLLQVYVGLALCYAPWSGQVLTALPWSKILWEQNPLFLHFPLLGHYAAMGWVRGLVTGVGLLNLWIAAQKAIRDWNG
jgi:hypothetical protein